METITVYEGKPVDIRSHLTKGDGTSLQNADVDSITAKLFDLRSDTPHTELSSVDLTPTSTYLFDTGVTSGWRKTGTYNFLYTVPGALMVQGGGHYRVEIAVDGVSEDDANWIGAEIKTVELRSG